MRDNKKDKAVQLVSQSDLFKAVSLAALKARACRPGVGEVIKTGGYEFVVEEEGKEVIIQAIQSRLLIETLAILSAEKLGLDLNTMADCERREWMKGFLEDLGRTLQKWQEVKIHIGPGDNLTFEKLAYKKD